MDEFWQFYPPTKPQSHSRHRIFPLLSKDSLCHFFLYTIDPWTIQIWSAWSTYMQIFSNKYLSWFWSEVRDLWLWRVLICVILYRGPEHPWILLSMGVLEPISHRYQGASSFGGEGIESCLQSFNCLGLASLIPTLFKGQLYFEMSVVFHSDIQWFSSFQTWVRVKEMNILLFFNSLFYKSLFSDKDYMFIYIYLNSSVVLT